MNAQTKRPSPMMRALPMWNADADASMNGASRPRPANTIGNVHSSATTLVPSRRASRGCARKIRQATGSP